MKALLIAASCMVVAACAAPKARSMAAPEAAVGGAAPGEAGSARAEIRRLADEIERERGEGQFAEPVPSVLEGIQPTPMATVPSSADATCKPAKTERCTSSCKLSDSICKNAGRICDLAEDLPGDEFAEGHCKRAKVTCDTAHASCCTCQ
jgi:hypothetical protein